ncbi:MAG: bifunctional DNA primase/polymerase [Dehalococcoidia bacterium]
MIPDEIEMVRAAGIRVGPLYATDPGRPGICSCYRGDQCQHPAKHPLTRSGKDDFTADRPTIERWARRWPGCNWGGRPADDVVVVDIDPRAGGDDSLARLELQHGPLPRTLTAKTGGGGWHYWFTGRSKRGTLGADHPGIDVKGSSGYLVLPPSVHASGRPYEWLDVRPAEYLPGWLHDLLNPPVTHIRRGTHVHPAALIRHVAEATENRNNRLYWAACRIAQQGGDPFILRDAAEKCGLEAVEYEKTLRSAARTYGLVPR